MKRNLLLSKLCVILMMLFGGVSFVSAEEACPKLTISPVSIVPGMEAEVSIQYESEVQYSAFQVRVRLPEGLSFVGKDVTDEDGEVTTQYGTVGNACLPSHTNTVAIVTNKESQWYGTLLFVSYNIKKKMMKNGTLCTFTVKADEKLAKTSQIKFEDILFSGISAENKEYHSSEMSEVIDVNNMKEAWDINEAAQAKVNEALQATMKVLNDADQQINDNCVELLRDSYLDQLAECSSIINKKAVELSEKYTAIELTEKDAEDFAATCAEVQAKVATILAEASEMTKKYEANEKANKDFQTVYQALIDQLDKADATINDECPAVKDTYLDKLAEIAGQANKLGMEIGELYAACELTQEKADAAVATVKELADKIDTIVADAIKAQDVVTGINGINADFQNAEAVYSIGGVRLNKAAKGVNVVIRNGKAIKVVK